MSVTPKLGFYMTLQPSPGQSLDDRLQDALHTGYGALADLALEEMGGMAAGSVKTVLGASKYVGPLGDVTELAFQIIEDPNEVDPSKVLKIVVDGVVTSVGALTLEAALALAIGMPLSVAAGGSLLLLAAGTVALAVAVDAAYQNIKVLQHSTADSVESVVNLITGQERTLFQLFDNNGKEVAGWCFDGIAGIDSTAKAFDLFQEVLARGGFQMENGMPICEGFRIERTNLTAPGLFGSLDVGMCFTFVQSGLFDALQTFTGFDEGEVMAFDWGHDDQDVEMSNAEMWVLMFADEGILAVRDGSRFAFRLPDGKGGYCDVIAGIDNIHVGGLQKAANPGEFASILLGAGAEVVTMDGTPGQGGYAFGGAGSNTINGTMVNDVIWGGFGPANSGNDQSGDTLDGRDGNDIIYGEGGGDVLIGGNGSDRLFGGAGDDSIDYAGGGSASSSAEYVDGGADYDTLDLDGGSNAVISFSFGDAMAAALDLSADTYLNLNPTGTFVSKGGTGTALVRNVERIVLGGGSNEILINDIGRMNASGLEEIDGRLDNDDKVVITQATTVEFTTVGHDTSGTIPYSGMDVIDVEQWEFGDGSDTVVLGDSMRDAHDNLYLEGGGGQNTVDLSQFSTGVDLHMLPTFSIGGTHFTGFNKVVATAGDDTITGSSLADTIIAGGGEDVIEGGLGDDVIRGGDDENPDTVKFSGNWYDYFISWAANLLQLTVQDTRSGAINSGTDLLYGIEKLIFGGTTLGIADALAGKATGIEFRPGQGAVLEGELRAGDHVASVEALGIARLDLAKLNWSLTARSAAFYEIDQDGDILAKNDMALDFESWEQAVGGLAGWNAGHVAEQSPAYDWLVDHGYIIEVGVIDEAGKRLGHSATHAALYLNMQDDVENVAPGGLGFTVAPSIDEGVPANTLVGTATAVDTDGDEIVWSLVDDADGKFRIDAATGKVYTTQVLDYEATPMLTIKIRATDEHGLADPAKDIVQTISVIDIRETFNGTAGVDTIYGTNGMDLIYGLGGADKLHGFEGNDIIYAGSGNDDLFDGLGSDALFGEGDNDSFYLQESVAGDVDLVSGGLGNDSVRLTTGATFHFAAGTALAIRDSIAVSGFTMPAGNGLGIDGRPGKVFLNGVENVYGANAINQINLSVYNDMANSGIKVMDFTAGANDVVTYLGQSSATINLQGQDGKSKVVDSSGVTFWGIDSWVLTSGSDKVTVNQTHVGTQAVVFQGGLNLDSAHFTNFTTDLTFEADGTVIGSGTKFVDFERFYGGSGNDTFVGTTGDDYFAGALGINTYRATLGADTYYDGKHAIVDYSESLAAVIFAAGSSYTYTASSSPVGSLGRGDTIQMTSGSGRIDIIGTAYDDTLTVANNLGTLSGGGGNDTLIGGYRNDTLLGGDGFDIIRPGGGSDTIDFGVGEGGVLDFSTTTGSGGVLDMLSGIFVFGAETDTVTGVYTKLIGTNGSDLITGTDGNDVIDSRSGTDTIYAGGGNDDVTITLGAVYGGNGVDIIRVNGKVTLVDGGEGGDTISVTEYGDYGRYNGGGGIDTITINGAVGTTIEGGEDGDIISIFGQYASGNTLSYESSDAGISLSATAPGVYAGVGGHAQGDVVSGVFNVIGSGYDDIIRVAGGSYLTLTGGVGKDEIEVLGGSATVYGGADQDKITINSGGTAYGDGGNDKIYGRGTMYGGEGDDEFFLTWAYHAWAGTIGNGTPVGATVTGGTGANTIHGSGGNDIVYMGEGSDTFIFTMGGRDDTIYNVGGDDTIRLKDLAPFKSVEDFDGYLYQVGSNVELRMGYTNDYPEHYQYNSSSTGVLGKITFMGMTISQVSALDWEFT